MLISFLINVQLSMPNEVGSSTFMLKPYMTDAVLAVKLEPHCLYIAYSEFNLNSVTTTGSWGDPKQNNFNYDNKILLVWLS